MNLPDLNTPLWQLTAGDLLDLLQKNQAPINVTVAAPEETRYVHGLKGIMEIFDCSKVTAQAIKNSGKINRAISQVGRTFAVDVKKALELAQKADKLPKKR